MTYLVILDAGHSLFTPGKRTPVFEDGSFMRENEFNRSVVRKIDTLLEQYENIDVVFTTTEKRDINLNERVGRVNDLYDRVKDLYDKIILISIHANALTGEWGSQKGIETYHYPTNETDKKAAEIIHRNLIESTALYDRGVKGGNFQILRDVKMTAVLCECGYMDNLVEAKLLMSNEYRDLVSEGIVYGLRELFGTNKRIVNVEYSATQNGTYQLKGDVKDFNIKIVNQSNKSIEEPWCVNGTFQWYLDEARTQTYPTSILYANGQIYQDTANHFNKFGCPQSVFIIYNDGKVEMKLLYNINELDLSKVRIAVGGVGLCNSDNIAFKFNPSLEGFKYPYNDVLRMANKTVLAYNKIEDKIYLMCRPLIPHQSDKRYDLLDLVKDCKFDIALSVDGGGSSFMNNGTDMVFKGDGRRINNIIGFGI